MVVMMVVIVVVIVMVVIMIVGMAMTITMVMVMAAAQEPGADKVDAEPEAGDRDCLAVGDRHRAHQPDHALIGNLHGDHPQDDGAGKSSQVAKFSCAKGEGGVTRLPTREQIGSAGDA